MTPTEETGSPTLYVVTDGHVVFNNGNTTSEQRPYEKTPATIEQIMQAHPKCGTCAYADLPNTYGSAYTCVLIASPYSVDRYVGDGFHESQIIDVEQDYCRHWEPRS